MKITKFGQCCLLIEVVGKRILTDPGKFSRGQDELTNLDFILITHEHGDHLHTESLQTILTQNPAAQIITNSGVGKILTGLNISFTRLEGSDTTTIDDLTLAAYDGNHAEIFENYGQVQNTGYFIAEQLFYPGDAYTEPGREVPILALPVAGPWCKAADAIRYAITVKPHTAFPVHDAILTEAGITLVHSLFEKQLHDNDITFTRLINNETKTF